MRLTERNLGNEVKMLYNHPGCGWGIRSPTRNTQALCWEGGDWKCLRTSASQSQHLGLLCRAGRETIMAEGKGTQATNFQGSKCKGRGHLYSKDTSVVHQMSDQAYSTLNQTSIPWLWVSPRDALWWGRDVPLPWFYCLLFCLTLNKKEMLQMKLYGPSRGCPCQNRIYCKVPWFPHARNTY